MVDLGGELTPHIQEANRAGHHLPEFARRPDFSRASNWITAGWWLNTTDTPVTYFRTEWEVPPAPLKDASQHLFLFNGMQPARGSSLNLILQPVLEWGKLGRSWSVASWIYPAPDGHVYTSSRVPVAEGDSLIGVIRLCDHRRQLFTYSCEFEDLPETRLCVANMPELVWCVETLEAYGQAGTPPYDLNHRTEYPNTDRTSMRRIKVLTDGPSDSLDWELFTSVAVKYGQHTEVVNDSSTHGRVEIFYGDDSKSFAKARE
jgi:hypothetical protein